MAHDGISRRYFFFGSLLAGAVPSAGFGSVPSLRALGYKPFYDKLNVASIGCGGQGGVDLNDAARTENIVAMCDVDEARAAANFKKFEKVTKYKDFRVMLDKEGKNIDACTIGIPDFMHATVALACMQRGKHVYLEKPLTRTPWEARLLMEAAAKYKVATQMGNQGFSHEANRVAAEMIWSGAIGDVTEAHISTTPGTHPTALQQPPPEAAVPRNPGLGPVAGRGDHAAVQPLLHAVQLARLSGFRHRADRQLGHAHGRPRAHGAATGRADFSGSRQRGGQEQHHLSGPRHGATGLSGARRDAGGEGVLSRWAAAHAMRTSITCPAWRTRPSCRPTNNLVADKGRGATGGRGRRRARRGSGARLRRRQPGGTRRPGSECAQARRRRARRAGVRRAAGSCARPDC